MEGVKPQPGVPNAASTRPLNILILEDAPTDAELMQRELRQAGIKFIGKRVATRAEFIEALETFNPDVLLCDYTLPDFTGRDALDHVRKTHPEVPVVMVTGTLGEEAAIELLNAGAKDYVLKNNLLRLPSAVQRVVSVEQGIRARKATEAALRASEARFRSLVEQNVAGVAIMREDGSVGYVNPYFAWLLGYAAAEIIGRPLLDFVPDSVKAAVTDHLRAHVAGERGFIQLASVMQAKDGHIIDVIVNASPTVFEGRPASLGVVIDVTEAKKAERQAAFNAAVLATEHEVSPDGILVVDEQRRWVSFNQRFVAMWGVASDIVASRSDEEAVQSVLAKVADPDRFIATLEDLYRRPEASHHGEIELTDGRTFERHSGPMPRPEGGSFGRVFFFRDISERKIAEQKVREEEAKFRGLVEQNVAGVAIIRADGTIGYLNPYLAGLLGYPPAEAVGKPLLDLVPADQQPKVIDFFKAHPAGEFGLVQIESAMLAKNGRRIDVIVNASRAVFEGEPASIGVVIDITERKAAETKLREEEAKFRSLVEQDVAGIVITRRDGTIAYANPYFARLGGYTPEEMAGRPVFEFMPASERAAVAQELRRVQFPGSSPLQQSSKLLTKDGRIVELLVSGAAATFDGEPASIAVLLDMTERQRAADALAYRDRILDAVTIGTAELVAGGSLAAGIVNALSLVGQALHVDRVLVLEDDMRGARSPLLRHAWQAPDVAVPISQALMDAGGPEEWALQRTWLAPLLERKPVISYFHSSEGHVRRIHERMQNKSTLVVPIFAGAEFWGSIGIDDCKAEREWATSEIETLQTFAGVIGSLILRDLARQSLASSEERFRTVSETAQDAIIMVDATGHIEYWNRAAERTLGYTAPEAIGKLVHDLLAPERFRAAAAKGIRQFAASGGGRVFGKTLEFTARHQNGTEIPVELSFAAMQIGAERHAVAILRDITERKRAEAQILRMARQDILTGLANRAVFVEELEHAIARARRGEKGFAVLYLDLDHFKDINDTLGHPIGDLMLRSVAERLHAIVRDTDTIARFGGDEFALIESDTSDALSAAAFAQKLLQSLSQSFTIQGNDIRTGTSIGIAMYGPDAPDAETLLGHADVALYRAKADGRGTYRFFTQAMDIEVRTRVRLGAELRAAIGTGQLFLVYQPQVDAPTGRIVGLEALVRWRHPERGLLMPSDFIPVAESSGLIVPLGQWVLRTACRQMKKWVDNGLAPPLVAVNVSALQFKTTRELEQSICAVFAETGLAPDRLELELTETALMEISRERSDALARLVGLGVQIAIDDFGTGYSSLDYLRRFPVDRLKIAQTFITDLREPGNTAIVKAAIRMAHEMHLTVVAEGVETPDQAKLIASWGCRHIQGYYFSKPLPSKELLPILRANKIVPRRAAGDPVVGSVASAEAALGSGTAAPGTCPSSGLSGQEFRRDEGDSGTSAG